MLQWADHGVRELQAEQEVACDPEVLVPDENIVLAVRLACRCAVLASQVAKVVSLLSRVEQRDQIVPTLQLCFQASIEP